MAAGSSGYLAEPRGGVHNPSGTVQPGSLAETVVRVIRADVPAYILIMSPQS